MKRSFSLALLYLLCFCFFLSNVAAVTQSGQLKFALFPENPRQGEPVTIAVGGDEPVLYAVLMAGGQRLARAHFFEAPAEDGGRGFRAALLTVPSAAPAGQAVIRVEGAAGVLSDVFFDIGGREFISEVIELSPVLTEIRTDPRRNTEAELLWAILNRTGSDVYTTGAFSPPVTSTRRTGFFGDQRVFKYSNGASDTSVHAGIDYGVPTGTPVSACGPGRVVMARARIVTGNSVVIEHLPGVYSLYYHLDKIEVSEGVIVETGTLLGLSGATGLATGPHLHWEIRVFGENTDPDALIARPILDKAAILSRIGN